jgi:hypothetical protein
MGARDAVYIAVMAWSSIRPSTMLALALLVGGCRKETVTTTPFAPEQNGGMDDGGSSSSGDDVGPPGPNTPLPDFCTAFASALLRDCSCAMPDERGSQFASAYYCEAVAREVASGDLVYDPSHAASCFAAAQAAACSTATPDWTECRAALAGKVAAGQPCRTGSPLETGRPPAVSPCAPGLFCMRSAANACDGVCTALPAIGQSCHDPLVCVGRSCATPCVSGAVCNGATGLCEAPAARDQPCGGDSGTTCAPGLYCATTDAGATDAGATDAGATDAGATDAGATDAGATDAGATDAGTTGAGTTGTCQPQKDFSSPCAQDLECAPPNVCLLGSGGSGGQCAALELAVAGGACSPSGNPACTCSSACGGDGTCIALAEPGSPCDIGDNTAVAVCHGGYCDTAVDAAAGGLCRPVFSVGHACGNDGQCGAYGACDPTSMQCVPFCFTQ